MSIIITIFLLFAVGSTFGWVLELLFRRFVSTKKWINPGFLVGPYLPLYGFGLSILFLISYNLNFTTLFNVSKITNIFLIVLFMTIMMTLIEYIAGIIFIKKLGVKLWDYSDRKGNIQGIICPLFTFFWGIVSLIFYLFLYPITLDLVKWFSTNSSHNIWLPFLLGAFYGIIFVDFSYSFEITKRISEFAKNNKVVIKLEALKEYIREFHDTTKSKFSFIFPLKSKIDIKEHLSKYIEKFKDIIKK